MRLGRPTPHLCTWPTFGLPAWFLLPPRPLNSKAPGVCLRKRRIARLPELSPLMRQSHEEASHSIDRRRQILLFASPRTGARFERMVAILNPCEAYLR